MTEVRLPAPVKATPEPRLLERGGWEEGTIESFAPGAFAFGVQGDYGKPDEKWDVIWFKCPCGCRAISCLYVGNGFKPKRARPDRATWEWDGNAEAPTLSPSIHHVGHWHGWLKNGFFVQA